MFDKNDSRNNSASPKIQKSCKKKTSMTPPRSVAKYARSSSPEIKSYSSKRIRYERSRTKSPRSKTRSRSRTPRSKYNRYSYSRSRSRSYSAHRSKSYNRRRSYTRSPSVPRKKYVGNRENPQQSRCLGVFGLSIYTTEQQITDIFSKYGNVLKVQIVLDAKTGRSRGYGFIYFENCDQAKSAKDHCSGMEIDDRHIRVDYSITQRAHTPTPGVYMGKPTKAYKEYYDKYAYAHYYCEREEKYDKYHHHHHHHRCYEKRSPSPPCYRERKRRHYSSRSRSRSPSDRRYR